MTTFTATGLLAQSASAESAAPAASVTADSNSEVSQLPQRGVFISFEGGEGVGKSTHSALLAARLQSVGLPVRSFRDPGSTVISERIRQLLLDPANTEITPRTELLLYAAARAQLVDEGIRPALEQGCVVLCDRFVDSTTAYQGAGRHLAPELVRAANQLASPNLLPDRTVVLLDDTNLALARATAQGADRLESAGLAFHEQVRQGFLAIAAAEPARVRLVPLAADKRSTAAAVYAAVADLFPNYAADQFQISAELLEQVRRPELP